MIEQKLEFFEFLDYITIKYKIVKKKFTSLNFDESALIKILMATYLDKFESKDALEFYDHPLSKREIDIVIENYDFTQINNEVLLEFQIPEAIEELETKVKIKSKGKIFIIHKNDADPFPSNPHAHWIDTNLKIDLSNGKCYHIRKHISTLSKKEFNELRRKAVELGIKLPEPKHGKSA
jgi:hypothetical protein